MRQLWGLINEIELNRLKLGQEHLGAGRSPALNLPVDDPFSGRRAGVEVHGRCAVDLKSLGHIIVRLAIAHHDANAVKFGQGLDDGGVREERAFQPFAPTAHPAGEVYQKGLPALLVFVERAGIARHTFQPSNFRPSRCGTH